MLKHLLIICIPYAYCQTIGEATIAYRWRSLDYDWPTHSIKKEFEQNGSYIVENNIISGIKIHNNSIYVTVPRWRKGVASTLNLIIEKHGRSVLKPYPSWSMQTIGNCGAIQFSQSLEIDPANGWMWIIDTGIAKISDQGDKICPPKLIIYDTLNQWTVRIHVFPEAVAPKMITYLNDIVLHKVSGNVKFAYISDAGTSSLVVYDYTLDKSYVFTDESMLAEHGPSGIIHLGNTSFPVTTPIDGIAMSPDFRYVYYCSLASYKLYRLPSSVLAHGKSLIRNSVKDLGNKISQTGGMIVGKQNLYFGALGLNSVYKWDFAKDIAAATSPDDVMMKTQTLVVKNQRRIKWVDSFAFDGNGYLWFTVNHLSRFLQNTMDFSTSNRDPNMLIWKVFVNERSYLDV